MASLNLTATATGAGESTPISNPVGTHACHIVTTTAGGAVTAVTVALEGSLDGVNWVVLGTHAFTAGEITAEQALFFITGAPVAYVRFNITTLTSTGTTTVKCWYDQERK